MAIWERYSFAGTLSTEQSFANTELFHNEEDTDNFQNADVVIVDGIVTVITDSDDLCGVRLLIAHELLLTASLVYGNPGPSDVMNYYQWFVGRGPLVFRLRAKRTIPPQFKLWAQIFKEKGTTSTAIRGGLLAYMQLKH